MISERDRDELRRRMPELLEARCGIADLRRSFRCPSPGHDDRDPSARYYADDNTVHCFGCGKTWDAFSLVGELDGIAGFADRARAVAGIVGYRMEEDGGRQEPRARRARKSRPLFDEPRAAGAQDCSEACFSAYAKLYAPGNEIGRSYLRSRGLDDDDIVRHGLGFTRRPKEVMGQFRVFEPEAAGFVTIPYWSRDFSEAHYCMLRTIGKGEVRCKEWRPAGIATPLWNEWMLSASLSVVYVAEGLIDAMALVKTTGGNSMALGGVSNAKRLAQVLYRTRADLRPAKIVVCMDEDDEGRRARDRICADLDVLGVAHAVMPPYPDGAKDADEWLMAGRGSAWDFEQRTVYPMGGVLYRTRWIDGR